MTTRECVLVCGACGYQWNEDCNLTEAKSGPREPVVLVPSTFYLVCPVCDANMVNEYAPDPDGVDLPWY